LEVNREIEKHSFAGGASGIPEKLPELEALQSWLGETD
jgi:hypothetical protein